MFNLFSSIDQDRRNLEAKVRLKESEITHLQALCNELELKNKVLQAKLGDTERRVWQLELESAHSMSKARILESNFELIKGNLERTLDFLVDIKDFDTEFKGLQVKLDEVN